MKHRIVVTTTLNGNLFRAKLIPLLRAREDMDVVVVTDSQGPPLDRVTWVWPRGFARCFGRLGGRLLLLFRHTLHPRTRLVMAYNVIPHGLFAVIAARPRHLPVFVHLIAGAADVRFAHNVQLADNRLIARTRNPRRIERLAEWTIGRAAKLFVPGGNTERFLQSEGVPAEKIVRLHSTIDPNVFFPGDAARDIDVLVSAQLRARKRPVFTLEVFRRILDERPAARFCWLGDGPDLAEFKDALNRLGLRDAVEWTVTDDVAAYYKRARVFLLCSINEGLSLACMEAMACGMVPVTTDCGDMADVVKNGLTGSLVPMDATPDDFARAALELLRDDETRLRLSRASADLIACEHAFDSATALWRELLSGLDTEARHTVKNKHP